MPESLHGEAIFQPFYARTGICLQLALNILKIRVHP